VRALQLPGVHVESERFEEVVGHVRRHTIDLISVRAVKSAPSLLIAIHRVLSPSGRVFFFHSPSGDTVVPAGFEIVELVRLGTNRDTRLSILKPVVHVEQTG
jgi:16S rRNA G527 N7-methylase RsmG